MSEFSTRLAMHKHTASRSNWLPAPIGDGYAADEAKSLDNARRTCVYTGQGQWRLLRECAVNRRG